MPTCKYCHKSTGWFSSVHKECEEKHAVGLAELDKCLKDFFCGRIDTSRLSSTIMNLRSGSFVKKCDALLLSRNIIRQYADSLSYSATAKDRQHVADFLSAIRLTEQEVNVDGTMDLLDEKIALSNLIQNLKNDILPQLNTQCPILLSRGESLVYIYNNVTMMQEKVEKEYSGDRSGWSFRVMKGVTYHTGGTKLKPVEHRYMNNEGVGSLYITTQNLIFQANSAALKIPYKKIVGITPYSDGIDVHRDGTNVKRLVFQGFDGGFLMQLLPYVTS